jgi:hypothetical protein
MKSFNINDFRISDKTVTSAQNDIFYTSLKHKDFLDENNYPQTTKDGPLVLAKCLLNKKSKHITKGFIGYSYYLRILPNKTLIDSRTLHSLSEPKSSYVDHICKSDQEFLEVSKDTFQKYINFLKTENIQWLNMAQKDIK